METLAATITPDRQPGAATPVRLDVDGVSFVLDVSRLEPASQQHHQKLSAAGQPYEPVMTRCLTRLIQQMPEPRFMDIGAFAGYYTCYVASLLGAKAKQISAIESNPVYCESIRQSCELNGLHDVRVYEAVLSNAVEPMAIETTSALVAAADAPGAAMSITLDELCERESIVAPNVIKMDIHGNEGKALMGMKSVLRGVEYLFVELHGGNRLEQYSRGVRCSDIMKLFWDTNLSVYQVAGHRAPARYFTSGRFAYRRITPSSADCLLFDRPLTVLLLVTSRDDLAAVLGESVHDPYFCYD
jgi:FkbM family methyltransferase